MRKAFFSSLEFWQQLVLFFSIGIVVLTLSTSLVLTVTANNSVKSQLKDQSIYLADSLARQARLSLLYESPEEAKQIVNIALQYPDVAGIKITTDKNRILQEQGVLPLGNDITFKPIETLLAEEKEDYLIFVAPVRTQLENDFLLQEETSSTQTTSEILGYVTLVISKSSLDQIWTQLLKSNLLVSMVVAVPLVLALVLLTRRLTSPLRSLSQVMHKAEEGELNLRASLKGPKDIGEMQKAFNTMMSSLERQNHELKIARDEALESAKVKAEFAANVSHELRTPMNSVLGMLDLLSVMGLSGQQLEYVETAKLSGQNLLALIDDILSYVRTDTGRLVLDTGPCNLEELIEDVIVLMSTQAMKKKLDIGYAMDIQDAVITADSQRLRQTLINLIGNAIKFTESGEVSLLVNLSDERDKLIFSVTDTGVGIGRDAQEKIFDAFTQEDSTTTRKFGGTGLGLAICKQFINMMGGEIVVQSEKGRGSTFTFTLPYQTDSENVTPIKPRGLLRNKYVAIVDDSKIVRDFLARWCRDQGAEIFSFTNLVDLFELISRLDKKRQNLDYLFVDEDLLGVKFDDIISMVHRHSSCSTIEAISMVNPWNKSRQNEPSSYSVLEKPLFSSRMVDYFRNTSRSTEAIKGQRKLYSNYLNLKVLVVDDNQANCLVAGGMLGQLGCDFETANNGEEALELISRKSYDVVLMDCNMPVMDGYATTATVRKMESDAKTTPILAMTANNSIEEKERCLASGMDDFIAKPLSVDGLFKKLEKWCDSAESPNESAPDIESGEKLKLTGLNLDDVENLKENVGEVFGSIVEAFIEDTPIYLESLRTAIQRSDIQQVFELSHTIKGSASIFGGNQTSRIARILEDKGKSGDLGGATELFEDLYTSSRLIMEYLARYIGENSQIDLKNNIDPDIATILVADDDRAIRMAFTNNLRGEGYRILEASNGQSALALCARTMPDLIIIDAIMPELDGFIACQKIREMVNGGEVPILMITSLEDEHSISKAFNAGATDYIPKPVNFSVLRQRVSRLLQSSRAQSHVRKLAYQDVLTGLPNRAFFNQQLRQKINRANINETTLALLFLDLDRFKVINDSLGHDMGDLVLKAAAERIANCVRESDLVARFGGDEFTVILEEIANKEIAGDISKKIFEALSKPFVFLKRRLFVSASIGVAIFPEDGLNASEIIKNADNAMYKAKESGGGYCFFHGGMEDEAVKRFEIENDIRTALEEDQFFLVYQPQIDFKTKKVRGVEALVRWLHPEKGMQPTSAFLPVTEETGLITELGNQVFRKACRQLQCWQNEGIDLKVSVNVSGVEFQSSSFSEQVFSLLEQYGFPADCLEIEITESMLMEQPELVQRELAKLRERGISVAIDDFGSGFSSLSYLKNFSVDILKIDKEFVRECHTNKNDQAIISGIIALAKTLNLNVVAEGIELQEQYDFLETAGCDYAQGYLLGRPAPLEQLDLT